MKNKLQIMLTALLIALLLPVMAQDRIYKTVDADGNVVYTDQKPTSDAEPLDLPELTVVEPVAIGELPARDQNDSADAPTDLNFRIVSPTQDEIIWNTAYTVDVQMAIEGNLPPGTEIVLFVDGDRKATTRGLSTTLNEVYRGPHTLYAELRLRQDGQTIATTDPVRFIIQQQSALRNQPG